MKHFRWASLLVALVVLISFDTLAQAQRGQGGQPAQRSAKVTKQGKTITVQHNAGVDMSAVKANLENVWTQMTGITSATISANTTVLETNADLSKRNKRMLLKGIHPVLKHYYSGDPRTKRFTINPGSGNKVSGENAPKDPQVKAFLSQMAEAKSKAEKQAIRKELRAYRMANRPTPNKAKRNSQAANIQKVAKKDVATRKARSLEQIRKSVAKSNTPAAKTRLERFQKMQQNAKPKSK